MAQINQGDGEDTAGHVILGWGWGYEAKQRNLRVRRVRKLRSNATGAKRPSLMF